MNWISKKDNLIVEKNLKRKFNEISANTAIDLNQNKKQKENINRNQTNTNSNFYSILSNI